MERIFTTGRGERAIMAAPQLRSRRNGLYACGGEDVERTLSRQARCGTGQESTTPQTVSLPEEGASLPAQFSGQQLQYRKEPLRN